MEKSEFAKRTPATLLPALLALSGCVNFEHPERTRDVARRGYECSVGRAFQDSVWFNRTLDEAGQQVAANMEWRGPVGDYSRPRVGVIWTVHGANPIRVQDGVAFISWARTAPGPGRPRLVRLELSTNPDGQGWPGAAFAGSYQRFGEYSLDANWSDLAAFARGAPQLIAVLRDREGVIVDQAAIDPALFTRAAGEVAATLERMRVASADFRNQCRRVEDVEPHIIVT